jgi:phenylalanyl-tRNA synthetase beta chain
MDVLRPSLLPELIHSLRHNASRKNHDVALFEIGRTFTVPQSADKAVRAPREERHLAIALTGRRHQAFWSGDDREAKFDFYDLKGVLEEFLEHFGVHGLTYSRRAESPDVLLDLVAIQLGKQTLGELGRLSPVVAKRYDLRDTVLLAELNLNLLLARRNPAKSFWPLPTFPAIRRDVAMIVTEATTHEAVLGIVRQAKPSHLEGVELFDVFRGRNVPDGHKSLAYAFTYRSPERTLTDTEINAAHEALVQRFRASLQATIRDA